MKFFEQYTLLRSGMRRKMVVAYALMAVIPLLVLAYFLVNYILPSNPPDMMHLSVILVLTLWISSLGYLVLRQMIAPLMKLADETKKLAEGNYGFKISVDTEDEVGDIAESVSSIKKRIQNYIIELDNYSRRTSNLNHRMQKNLLTLTSLMNLADMISAQTKFQQITDYAARKIAEEMMGGFCAIYVSSGGDEFVLSSSMKAKNTDIGEQEIAFFLTGLGANAKSLPFFEFSPQSPETGVLHKVKKFYPEAPLLVHPLSRKGEIFGMIVAGNGGAENFSAEDKEMIEAFGKELLLVAVRSSRYEPDGGKEEVTGLCGADYFLIRTQEEVTKAALHKSTCSVMCVMFEGLDNGDEEHKGDLENLKNLISGVITSFLPDGAEAAICGHEKIMVLLPGMNKQSTCELAEELRAHIRERELPIPGSHMKLMFSIGVSESPVDGIEPAELIEKAQLFMDVARASGGDRVIGNEQSS